MPFSSFFRRRKDAQSARRVYQTIVQQAREPAFYTEFGVPDSVDGRFDMIALHGFLVLNRLKQEPAARDLAQALFDALFADMDESLREMGAGDLGVGRRVKSMVAAFMGRVQAYESGLREGDSGLEAALKRNLYRASEPSQAQLSAIAIYMRHSRKRLAEQELAVIVAGEFDFGPINWSRDCSLDLAASGTESTEDQDE